MSGNIMDYLLWRGDVSFAYSRFNAVDALILSTFTYVNFPKAAKNAVTFREGFADWEKLPEDRKFRGLGIMKNKNIELVTALADNKRFSEVRIGCYVESSSEKTEQQFSAMTFFLPDGNIFIGFRGTDNSLVGWKEDFNMAVRDGIPSQLEATRYVERIAGEYPDARISLGGHSKGGNLAVWAAANVAPDIRKSLKRVYVFDSPGLSKRMFESKEYLQVKDRIISFVPEGSIVGIIMYNPPQLIVKSNAELLMQHDLFSWQVSRNGFEYLLERGSVSRFAEKRISAVVDNLDPGEYTKRVNRVFDEIKSTASIKKGLESLLFRG